jgi:hypothetical protein
MSTTTTQELVAKIKLQVESGQAVAPLRTVTDEIKRMDKASQEAHANLNKLGRGAGGTGYAMAPSGSIYPIAGGRGPSTYGFAGLPQGQSAGQAFSHNVAPAGMPTYQPGAYPGSAPRPTVGPGASGGYGGAGQGGGLTEWMQIAGKAAATAGSVIALASAIDKLGQVADRVRYSTDPSGQRLSPTYRNLKTGIDTATDLPVIGYGLRAGAGATDYLIDQGITGLAGLIPGLQPGQRRAAQSYYRNAQLSEAMAVPAAEAERRIRDYQYDARVAGFRGEAYDQFRAGEEGRRAATLAQMQFSPDLAVAGMAERRAQANYGAAFKTYAAAGGEATFYGDRAARLQSELAQMRSRTTSTGPIDTAFSSLAPTAMMTVESQRLALKAKENELAKALADQQDALNRKQEAGLTLAQAKAAVDQQSLALAQTKLSIADAELGKAAQFGTSSPLDQLSALTIARKLNGPGGVESLTMAEREFAMGNGIIGAYATRKIGQYEVANNPELAELYKLTGQLERLDLAKQRDVLLQGDFNLRLQEGAGEKIAAQIKDQILPGLVNSVNAALAQAGINVQIDLNNAQAVQK